MGLQIEEECRHPAVRSRSLTCGTLRPRSCGLCWRRRVSCGASGCTGITEPQPACSIRGYAMYRSDEILSGKRAMNTSHHSLGLRLAQEYSGNPGERNGLSAHAGHDSPPVDIPGFPIFLDYAGRGERYNDTRPSPKGVSPDPFRFSIDSRGLIS